MVIPFVYTKGRLVVHGSHRPILVIYDRGYVFALDNRCPHMGFPLERGSVFICQNDVIILRVVQQVRDGFADFACTKNKYRVFGIVGWIFGHVNLNG